ncbi:MAG TPA: hypothetical protein VFF69_13430, partial [Phycisphaerales bacterium]|nr:hypothetical protein [Phycisphaerales bacterium]
VVSVPIEGEIGVAALAPGVQRALRRAATLGATDIVFVIDSPGGRVADARVLQLVLAEHDASFQYHAIVESAISAAVWVLASCDTIHVLPGGSAGGAVVFAQDHSSGSVHVDAKMNSILCAEVAAAAAAKGHPSAVFEAMMVMEKELYAETQADGLVRLTGSRSSAGSRVIDGSQTVLTMTAEQMADLGVARAIPSADLPALAASLGVAWRELPRVGMAEMLRASNDLARIARERDRAAKALERAAQSIDTAADRIEQLRYDAEQAVANIPIYSSSYLRLRDGDRSRRDAIDYAVSRWDDVVDALHDLDAQESAHRSAHRLLVLRMESEHKLRLYPMLEEFTPPEHVPVEHTIEKDGLYQKARREQTRLNEMK